MRWFALVVLVVACSPSPHTATPDRPGKDDAPAKVLAEAGTAPAPAADAASARSKEVEDALGSLWSEHAQDIPPATWWKAHAAEVRPALRDMLADGKDDGEGDRHAIQILGDLGDPADVEVLAKVLNEWKFETARASAAAALGVHPAPAASEALIAASKLPDVTIASHATSGLGSRKNDDAARKRLEELLDHPDSTMRFRAVNALREMGGSRDALVKRSKVEKDAEVKSAINKALKAKP